MTPVIFLSLVICLHVTGSTNSPLIDFEDRSFAKGDEKTLLAKCGQIMNVKFPDSARLVGVKRWKAIDALIILKVEIAADHLDQLLTSSPFSKQSVTEKHRFVHSVQNPRIPWWNPDSPQKFKSGKVDDFKKGETLAILIDLDRNDRLTVYLKWGTT